MNIEFQAHEFETADEAIKHAVANGGEAVFIHGRHMVVDKNTLDVLHSRGVEFAYLHEVQRADGQRVIVTIPVND